MRRALLTLLAILFAHVLADDGRKLFLLEMDEEEVSSARQVADHHGYRLLRRLHSFPNIFVAEQLPQRRKRSLDEIVAEIVTNRRINWAEPVTSFIREKRWLFSRNKSQNSSSSLVNKVSGKGVVVAILDDGMDYTHPSLAKSYSPEHSFNFVTDSSDPLPDDSLDNNHGTHCAGVVAMSPSSFGTGVSPEVSLAALKMLGSTESINDIQEGDALAYHHKEIDVYSVSWGPRDDGKSLEAPRRLASMALERGATQGRRDKGSLYVWASGNGGLEGDDCAMDGYASHKYTLTFGVVGSNGKPEWYAEGCPAVIASVSSDSASRWTTEVGGGYSKFSGSSAAAPFAAGILALLLEANPELTQRDVQHLLVHSSQSDDLVRLNPEEWQKNGAGLYVSRYFGFGALNRDKLLSMAASWKPVSVENTCSQEVNNGSFSLYRPLETTVKVDCKTVTAIERVQLVVSLSHSRRGDVQIELVSPAGTSTQMMRPRRNDDSSDGLTNWTFVSLHNWGEKASGNWMVRVIDTGRTTGGHLTKMTLHIHGTST